MRTPLPWRCSVARSRSFPADFWINHDLGIALSKCQPPQPEEAIRFLTSAVALRPDSPAVRLNLGFVLARAGRPDEALVAYRQAIALKADYSMAHYNVGVALGEQGHLDEAVVAYRQAIRWKPDYSMAHFELGLALGEQVQLDEAIAACRRAIQLKPDHSDAHYSLGIFLRSTGRLDEAMAAYRKAIALEPDHAESHCSFLAGLWRLQGGEVAEPVVLILSSPFDHVGIPETVHVGAAIKEANLSLVATLVMVVANVAGLMHVFGAMDEEPQHESTILDGLAPVVHYQSELVNLVDHATLRRDVASEPGIVPGLAKLIKINGPTDG